MASQVHLAVGFSLTSSPLISPDGVSLTSQGGDFGHVSFGTIICEKAKKLKGCYTRYVSNYDVAEAALARLKENDKEKHRYLEASQPRRQPSPSRPLTR